MQLLAVKGSLMDPIGVVESLPASTPLKSISSFLDQVTLISVRVRVRVRARVGIRRC